MPLSNVAFEFILISRRADLISEDEFSHLLLTGERAKNLSRDARLLLQKDCLKLTSEKRTFQNGRPHHEPEIFRICRQMANIGQIQMGPSDHDLIAIGRGAHRLRYQGPATSNHAQLELAVHAAETIRRLRPGIIVDREAHQIWGEHAWESQLTRPNGLGVREHFKIEMGQQRTGARISTRGLAKFGLPDLRMEKLPADLAGMAAITMTSISLDLIAAESLDTSLPLSAPAVRGRFSFQYTAPKRNPDDHSAGIFTLIGGVDGEESSELGLLEILSRLRRRYEDGEEFQDTSPKTYALAQETLGRFKEKYNAGAGVGGRVFLIQRIPTPSETLRDSWYVLQSIEGFTYTGVRDRHPDDCVASFDESEICDWVILRDGDVEDGGFGLGQT